MTDGFIPAPIAQLPWRLLWLIIAIGAFGSIVLYSAAGGSFTPWAASHALLRLFGDGHCAFPHSR
jgi:rod shape determining protein RodA